MIEEFIDKLQIILEEEHCLSSDMYSQKQLRYILKDVEQNFPMTCFEYTSDDMFEEFSDRSKFLYDEVHDGKWMFIDDVCLVCFQDNDDSLIIDVFEVNDRFRGEGFGRKIVECIEKSCEGIYNNIKVVPFDTKAETFWEHMCYTNYKGFIEYVKEIW